MNKNNFSEFIAIECYQEVTCSNCGKTEGTIDSSDDTTELEMKLQELGWATTNQNIYCPTCAKKKLRK